ncbi:MAG: putative quinol monooxygenase [Paracoccaceae bacterium]|nr:putative quinol monooxygenase [Paracoccaceae bacterium]
MYVVTVRFQVKSGCEERFLTEMQRNAATSLSDEPGCHRFDVAIGEDGPGEVFLYELYTDRAAFDAHLSSAHFKSFDAQAADWVAGKDIACFHLVG